MKRSVLRKVALLGLLVFVASLAAGCGGGKAPEKAVEKPKEPIKIGGIFDITGATGDVGTPYAQGAKAYVRWINSKGGVNGRPLELIDIDYQYKIPQAVEAYKKLVNVDKVVAIMGWGTGDTEAMREFIAADKIPYVSGSYSEGLLNIQQSPYNFLVAASYSDQARIVLKWIKDNWKDNSRPPRVALLYNDTGFGKSHLQDAKDYAKQIGVDIVDEQVIALNVLDATPQLSNMKLKAPDFGILQYTSNATSVILKDSKKLGINTQYIGLNYAADEIVVRLAKEAAEGYIGVIPFAFPYETGVPGLKDVEEGFAMEVKKLSDLNQKHIQGWVSMAVLVEGIRRAGDTVTGETIRKGLETMSSWDTGGLAAPVTFTSQSHRGSEKVKLSQVKDGKFVPLTDWIGYK